MVMHRLRFRRIPHHVNPLLNYRQVISTSGGNSNEKIPEPYMIQVFLAFSSCSPLIPLETPLIPLAKALNIRIHLLVSPFVP